MESDTQYCDFNGRHKDKKLAVKIMRSTCPNYPDRCSYYRIKLMCPECATYVEDHITRNEPMHCVTCSYSSRCATFWSIVGDV